MHQHIFNSFLKRHSTWRTPSTSSFHLNKNKSFLFIEVNVFNIAAILLHKWPQACLYNFFYHLDCLTVRVFNFCVIRLGFFCKEGLSACVVLSNDSQNFRFHYLPVEVVFFCHWNEVISVEDARNSVYLEKLAGERRNCGVPNVRKIHGWVVAGDRFSRREFETARIGRRSCLYEQ